MAPSPLPVPALTRALRDVFDNPFYADEKLSGNPDASRFADPAAAGTPKQMTFRMIATNPIETQEQVKLGLPVAAKTNSAGYFIFVPDPTRAAVTAANAAGTVPTVKVSLLFCVGSQMNRAGLRTYFEERSDAVLITIPGWETTPSYGIGITDAMISKLFTLASLMATPEIRVIAGFSTGYRGLIGSVNEKTITVDKVNSMVFYDCLYIADDYFPGGNKKAAAAALADVRTEGAVDKVLTATKAAGKAAEIVIYDVTQSGTIHYPAGRVAGGPLAVNGHTVIDLKSQGPALQALQLARLMDEGATDGFLPRSKIPASIAKLIPLPLRGQLISSGSMIPGGGKVRSAIKTQQLLKNWGASVSLTQADIDFALSVIFVDELMGWQPRTFAGTAGEMMHDQFMPEFAGEFLTPP